MTHLTKDELEDIVENEPLAGGVLAQVEGLRVGKGALLIIDLASVVLAETRRCNDQVSLNGIYAPQAGRSPG
jgi:hypothetical protein